jgi:poly-D-alanine transfer protein DltD
MIFMYDIMVDQLVNEHLIFITISQWFGKKYLKNPQYKRGAKTDTQLPNSCSCTLYITQSYPR